MGMENKLADYGCANMRGNRVNIMKVLPKHNELRYTPFVYSHVSLFYILCNVLVQDVTESVLVG